ncbi:hypothetical protein [Aequorivita echinoideorum]|uniref:Lipocalin-like domain-containing protein n=1 Tax=Aequorivita echinoideorum TaxID=1549647 RepID=A0ABS5S4T8_9FLAO|nr:hypothetical protein [Aequorivita echinoideorum]MBT0608237.1 hypothetical protein [Aequorivita echinoideorum]
MQKTIILLFFAVTTLLSCKNDENNTETATTNLRGEWLRSDASENYGYTLFFNAENKGYSTEYIKNPDGTAISGLREYIWNTEGNILTLTYTAGGSETSPFTINSEGQLIVTGISELPFNKVE